tara:strand:- start:211 stop:579 length:369 start_codon:yes stop_codon:yes gene_type:complete
MVKIFKIISIIIFSVTSLNVNAQTKITKVSNSGIQVVEFNAKWNSTKNVSWLNKLSDCSVGRLLIDENPKFQSRYKILVVPTIIVFRDGEEMERFQANIMMDMEVTVKDVQESVDDAHMEGF